MKVRAHPIVVLEYSESEWSFDQRRQTNFLRVDFWSMEQLDSFIQEKVKKNSDFELGHAKNGWYITPIRVLWGYSHPNEELHIDSIGHFCELRWIAEKAFATEDKTVAYHALEF